MPVMSRVCLLLAVAVEAVSALEPHHERSHEHLRQVFAESAAQKAAQAAAAEHDAYFSVGYLAKSKGQSLKAEAVCKGGNHCCTKFKALPKPQLTVLKHKLFTHNSHIDEKDLNECAWDYEMTGCISPRETRDKKWEAHERKKEYPGKGALICQNEGGWVKVVLNQEKEKASSTVTLHLAKEERPHVKLTEEAHKDLADHKFSGGFYRSWKTAEENKDRHKYKFYSTKTLTDRLGDFAIKEADGKIAYRKFYVKASLGSLAGAVGGGAVAAGKGAMKALGAAGSAIGGFLSRR